MNRHFNEDGNSYDPSLNTGYMSYMDYVNSPGYVEPGQPWGWANVSSDHAEAVSGVDLGISADTYRISIDKGMLKVLVEETVRDVLGDKTTKPVVIQKYKMKHK